MRYLLLFFSFAILAYGQTEGDRKAVTTDELGIELTGQSRGVIYTNKAGGYFYTETSAGVTSSREGWYVNGRKVLDDYTIMVDERPLKRSDIVRTMVYPHQFVREYRNGTKEIVTLVDHSNVLLIELDSVRGKEIVVRPYFRDVRDTSEIIMRVQYGEMYVGKKNRDVLSTDEFPNLWLGLLLDPGTTFSYIFYESVTDEHGFSPASIQSSVPSKEFLVEFFASENPRKLVDVGVNTMKNFTDSIYDRRVRMDQMMKKSYLRTDREDLTRALNWAKVSLDALLIDDDSKGIWNGLPHGEMLEARSIFSTITGSLPWIGNFSQAKSIFRKFAATQDTDSASPTYGCISDMLGDSSKYRNADATPLFVAALNTYLQYTGDSLFASEMFPFVKRSIEGTLRYRTDSLLFQIHGNDATWMNVPRGNRANDIQAYWLKQLQGGIDIDGFLYPGADREEVSRWKNVMSTLKENFRKYFVDSVRSGIFDHLPVKGKANAEILPNQLVDIELAGNNTLYQSVFANVTSTLVYPLGVSTKSGDSPEFHPFRYAQQYYAPQYGLCEGVIYPWLAGEWVTQAAKFGLPDTAMEVTLNLSRFILRGNTLGSLPEIFDAVPVIGDSLPRESGFRSSARSLAEYLRGWYEGYLGVKVDRMGSRLTLRPNLPAKVHDVDFNVPLGSSPVTVHYKKSNDQMTVELSTPPDSRTIDVVLVAPVNYGEQSVSTKELLLHQAEMSLPAGGHVSFVVRKDGIHLAGSGKHERLQDVKIPSHFDRMVINNIHLAPSLAGFGTKDLVKSPVPLFTIDDVKRPVENAKVLCDVAGTAFDTLPPDYGAYPRLPGLKRGSLSVSHFTVSTDTNNVYFHLTYNDLCYPVGNPERGFDRTITAVAIDKNEKTGSQQAMVGRNARYSFINYSFSEIIYIGNGLRVEDAKGKTLLEYFPIPSDERSPLGEFNTNSIVFSIPVRIIGKPGDDWKYAVVTGVRDDTGGDVGNFQTIEDRLVPEKGDRKNKSTGNVVDVLIPSPGK
jgi:glycogen debranching enzyme